MPFIIDGGIGGSNGKTIQCVDGLVFKGLVGNGTDFSELPDDPQVGWSYRVMTAGEYAGEICEVGDLLICISARTNETNVDWAVIQANIEGAVTADTVLPLGSILLGAGEKRVTP